MLPNEIPRQRSPAVVAHRGSSATYPENTLDAFDAAVSSGADVVELDVRMTADQQPIVMHDADVAATTDGTGFVHTLTLGEVKRLNAARGREDRVEVPTLAEALALLSGRCGVNIEVKNLPGEPSFDWPREAAAEAAVRTLHDVGFEGFVLVSSFNWLSIERVRQIEPSIPTGFLTTAVIDPRAALRYVVSNGHTHVLPQSPAIFEAGQAFVEEAHAEGIAVGTWTVDLPEGVEELFGMGVDAIATNDPEMAVPIRDRFRREQAAQARTEG
jgi:glycerophosphoryl diester phosphodiesterase